DPEAIDAVRLEAWPEVRDFDEMHEALMGLGYVTAEEARAPGWQGWLCELADSGRATALRLNASDAEPSWWVATEGLPQALALFPDALATPPVRVPEEYAQAEWTAESALIDLLRSR
ncbi:hypothetical protein AB4084_32940, partial [Lysobacter sp. 2RAB21]